ncbi:monoheme cytochrome C [Lutimonas sp.]|jgi:hypothetical protein|uniref:monoheme cytochrome C n=1 Tax=Lutimonas sp. TaxID=1872403 RepID=UPI003C722C90
MESRDKKYGNTKSNKWILFGFIFTIGLVLVSFIAYLLYFESNKEPENMVNEQAISDNEIENGIHVRTGLKEGEGLMTVVTHCTACHSAQLIIQNRMNKERWNATIRWMQETQNLWPLGENQEVIVNYLVKNYPVYSKGRRENLQNIEWYELSE